MTAIMVPVPTDGRQAPATRRVQDARRHPHLARELATLRAMIRLHCHDLHGEDDGLCAGCAALLAYATRRLDRCAFGDDKPTCANCSVHCYGAAMREEVRTVMRHSGPRIVWRHPMLALRHLADGRRAMPPLPAKTR
jgi:hypothetical protein